MKIEYRDNKSKDIKVSKNYNIYENDIVKFWFERPVFDSAGTEVDILWSGCTIGVVGFSLATGRCIKKSVTFLENYNNSDGRISEEELKKCDSDYPNTLWISEYPKPLKVSKVEVIGNLNKSPNLFNDCIEELKEMDVKFINGKYIIK